MAAEFSGTDLFGAPFAPPREGRGRPAHAPTRETRNKVLLCFVRGLTVKDTAAVMGVAVSTLREHYSSELQQRKVAATRFEMHQLARLNDQAEAGNVAADKELAKRLDALRLRDKHLADAPAPTAKAERLGKKAEAERAAQEQRGLYEPPAPPMLN